MEIGKPVDTSPTIQTDDYLRWKTEEVLKARDPDGWREVLRGKAERLLLDPLVRKYDGRFDRSNLAVLGAAAVALKPNRASTQPRFFYELSTLARRLVFFGENPDLVFLEQVNSIFAPKANGSFWGEHSPASFLNFSLAQIGWRAVKEGWVVCVAEDEGELYSWVDPVRLPALSDSGRIELPNALNVALDDEEIDARAALEVGADRLWFVLREDLDCENPSKPGPKSREKDEYLKKVRAAAPLALKAFPPPRLMVDDAAKVFANLGISEADVEVIWGLVRPKNCEKKGRLSLEEREARAAFLLDGGMAALNENIRELLKKIKAPG